MQSLYSKYKEELENSYISHVEGVGFASWSRYEDSGVYVQEVYVSPDKRGNGHCFDIIKQCIRDARKKDINVREVFTSVDVTINTINLSLKVITKLGFDYYGSDGNTLYFIKEIK